MWRRWKKRIRQALAEMMSLARRAESALRHVYRPDGFESRAKYRQKRRRGSRGPHSHARAAPVVGRREFHDVDRGDSGIAGGFGEEFRAIVGGVRRKDDLIGTLRVSRKGLVSCRSPQLRRRLHSVITLRTDPFSSALRFAPRPSSRRLGETLRTISSGLPLRPPTPWFWI